MLRCSGRRVCLVGHAPFAFSFNFIWVSLRVGRKFTQLNSDELPLRQRLPGRQQWLPQRPEHEQSWAEDAALLPWCCGEEHQSRGPGCSPGTANALLLLLGTCVSEVLFLSPFKSIFKQDILQQTVWHMFTTEILALLSIERRGGGVTMAKNKVRVCNELVLCTLCYAEYRWKSQFIAMSVT